MNCDQTIEVPGQAREGAIGIRLPYFVYILASRPHGAIYVGSTRDLRNRVEQHRSGAVSGHTRKYQIHTLVWFEIHEEWEFARLREHRIKRWRRTWKNEMIEAQNSGWRDICDWIPY